MADAFIYDHVRTPRGKGKPDGALHEVTPIRLATTVLDAVRDRNGLDTALVDDVVMGIVMPVGEQGQCLPRVAAVAAGYAEQTAGVQVNRFCASGLEACNIGAAKVMAGQADMVVTGGVESMSRVPILSDGGAWGADPQIAFGTYFVPQGISADLIATRWGYDRERLDAFAVESHRRAARAWSEGRFDRSVVAVHDRVGDILLARDETIRGNSTLEDLARLKPSFAAMGEAGGFDRIALERYPDLAEIHHVHHAGNSSGIVDGAAAVLIGTREAGSAAGLRPRARIRAFAEIGSEPTIMLTAPSFAAEKALKRAGMSAKDIDLYEINEAFASVAIRFIEAMDADPDAVNVNGGAIAMGHPLGATGAIILGTALDELERTGKATALVTLCVGAGMGVATIIERV
ncbi:acetyl-CoA C-acetyltransferase [Polymorphum gilvum]|uniref:Putative 3-ketoacyl-CoA thiolase (Fatty oxidation complex beta subunit) (Beta-ketothiolase) (Acetyl-CoA acyltransferase) (FadA-like) n=1 Tax=Polymorphum gilvum (strain LMG 25793 / CGMCC 1.9160 / SL003B-26A1) TaxID=991905 RepID=F2J2M5_POLGS|nr:acetyl-CoA C-acetyltransferase [Polymorphum gilvum]ADZ70939.1 Putative 3-ketoacyl-CoA thiolase (Fatty oxidation complex beta subunit) (Beta-ketothiolase) (Acetyl-CoA acyltransferase) (FadA-like) [Polymorphum gilvum SL003B-26A1]